jgi:hypothetical protein
MKTPLSKSLPSKRFYKQPQELMYVILLSIILLPAFILYSSSGNILSEKENVTSNIIFPEKSKMIIRLCLGNDLVLDVSRRSMSDNASVSIYGFQSAENQFWFVEKIIKGYIIRSSYSKKVLAVNMENSSIVQQDFMGMENQIWIISGTLNAARIMNLATHQNLAIVNFIVNKNRLGTDFYSESKCQLWNFESLYNLQKETVSCDCPKLLEYTKNLIETEYPGYKDKVNVNTKSDYLKLCELSFEKAKKTKISASCFKIIDNYLSFFKDGHIQFYMSNVSEYGFDVKFDATNQRRKFYSESESVKMDENDVRNYLGRNKGKLSSIEGIWESREEKSRYAIIRDPSNMQDFIGFVLKADSIYWMPGQVKINFIKQKDNLFNVYYYRKNHTIDWRGRHLDYLGMQKWIATEWIKQYPVTANIQQLHKKASLNNNVFQLKNLDDSTLFLSLPNFAEENIDIVDNLIKTNKDKILRTPFLIIDMRENGGGTDLAFHSILPFIYTNPYKLYGNDILASKENIAWFEQGLCIRDIPKEWREFIPVLLKRMKENPGKLVVYAEGGYIKRDSVTTNPRKVIILIKGSGSSGEQFLLHAKESKKVVMLGQPTLGILDYSNITPREFPSSAFHLSLPQTRSRSLPNFSVDKEKIKPSVYLTDDQDWIEEARKHLKR